MKLVDAEGNEVPKGQSGILYVRSEASGTYYHLEHEKTKRTFVGNDWVNTNDLFKEDADGYFWYEGRADDLIKVSGVYVAPLEIEKCLEEHKAVRECTVLGIKDADGLAKTKAFIVLHEGFDASDSSRRGAQGSLPEEHGAVQGAAVHTIFEGASQNRSGQDRQKAISEGHALGPERGSLLDEALFLEQLSKGIVA